jgi:spore coat protein CotH
MHLLFSRVLSVSTFALLATACGDGVAPSPSKGAKNGDADAGDNDGTDTEPLRMSCGEADPELRELDSQELFDWPFVPTFDIYLPPEEWEQLQEDAVKEEYIEAEACFEGRGIGKVGIRFKGAVGSLYSCFTETGDNICRKLGIKLKFSEYDLENRFFGMKRLNFQGNRYDDTYMKEKLAYELYRSMDIVAPRVSWAQLRVNDELQGLFGMVEQVDGRFTDNRWPENGDGNLFKELWPINTDAAHVTSKLRTNEEEPDVSAFVAFSEAVLAADEAMLRETLGEFMDLDYVARYMAVDDAIANFDGMTAYYTDEDALWAGNHNFYIYEEAPDHFTFVPWDLESTFSLGGFSSVPHWTVLPEDCGETYTAWGIEDLLVMAPGCDPMFKAMAQNMESYEAAGQELLEGAFRADRMFAQIDQYEAFIRDAVEADPNGPGVAAFTNELDSLKTRIPLLNTRLEYLLAGEILVPLEFDIDGLNGFENQTDSGLITGTGIYPGAGATADFTINSADALSGERSLRIDFEFANAEDPWQQTLNYIVPMTNSPHDVSSLTGIRLQLRADQSRELRLELDSTYTTASDDWLRRGWGVAVSDVITEVEVRFEDAVLTSWGTDPASTLEEVLSSVIGINFFLIGSGIDEETGFLPDGTTDVGFLEVDDVEFF